ADPERVRQILHSLVVRALTRARPNRPVRVRAGLAPGGVQVFVDHDAPETEGEVSLRVGRALAAAQGGRLAARSRAGGGLRFIVELPLAETPLSGSRPAAHAVGRA